MKLANIAALFLGNFLPVAQSYCSFGRILSELQFEAEADDIMINDFAVPDLSEDTEWDGSDIVRFLSRRSDQITLSEQCVEDDSNNPNRTESEEEELDALDETMQMKGCRMYDMTPNTTYSMEATFDNSNCSDEVSRFRAVCDADDSYQLVEWRAFKTICTAFASVDNTTTALQEIIYNMHWKNATSCVPKSCPSDANDWTAADMEFYLEQSMLTCDCGYVNASCTVEYLEDSDAVVQTQEEVDSGAKMAQLVSSTFVGLVTAAMALLMM